MRKLLFITFICSSLCAYAQSEIPEDTIKNRPPVKKEQIPFSPKENKRTGLDESQPQQSLQDEQQEEINLHLPPSDYVEPLPWTDMKKIHFQKNIFEWDFQRFADFNVAGNQGHPPPCRMALHDKQPVLAAVDHRRDHTGRDLRIFDMAAMRTNAGPFPLTVA